MKVCSKMHSFDGKRCQTCKRNWEIENADRIRETRKLNAENLKASKKRWALNNPEKSKNWKKENPDKYKECIKKWRKANPNSAKLAIQKWRKANPGLRNNYISNRRAKRISASPKWLTKQHLEEIKNFYIKAKALEKTDNIKRNVDHIVPLQSDIVCGLHVPWNLQILTCTENCRKGNKLIKC